MHTFSKFRYDDGTYGYTVGYWCPAAYGNQTTWQPLFNCKTAVRAARLVNYLNGGTVYTGELEEAS